MSCRVAVVTGANKGIGFALVKALCKEFDGDVLLTARDADRGHAAVKALEEENLHPKFHQLDVTDIESIVRLRDHLKATYNGLDLLVNNAAIFMDIYSKEPLSAFAAETMNANYTGQVRVSEQLFPLLRPHSRVVNMSTGMAYRSLNSCSEEIQARFKDPNISVDQVTALMNQFVSAAEAGQHSEQGFDGNAYGMSKLGFTVLTVLQQQEMDRLKKDDIVINCCSPGYVNTDMTLGQGSLTVEEGIVTPLHLCLLPPNVKSPRGQMMREMRIVDWTSGQPIS